MSLDLRGYTPARVSLGRAGCGLPTRELLEFQLAEAQARDAVHAVLDVSGLMNELARRGLIPIALKSAAANRDEYLRNPALGRALAADSDAKLRGVTGQSAGSDVVFILADGLSAIAIQRHALPLIGAVLALLAKDRWRIGPACVVEQGRVAVGDCIGEALGAQFSVVLIGERPGLSSPDSLGIYVTWEPRPGRTDAERNCISNVRPEGLSYAEAARRLCYLLTEGRRRRLTGVALKDGPSEERLRVGPARLIEPL
ncbi:MAG TPA: ethanolamine ammonia-lyase subunit EutC [Acidisarcina sp.]